MPRWDYTIIGGGPAGAALAHTLARRGLRVRVLESAPRPGMKPCGRGIPDVSGLPVRIPRECERRRIRGATLYVDGVEVFSIRGIEGFIVDRTCLTETLINGGGAELYTGASYRPQQGYARINGTREPLDPHRTIIAGGHPFYRGETIAAVQRVYRGIADDTLYIYFDTKLIGYYWIFPGEGDTVEIGVGGFAGFQHLEHLLDRFLEENPRASEYRGKEPLRREGARIAVGGIDKDALTRPPIRVGEAAGFVLPLTGEGIRPSMISGALLGEALASGDHPDRVLHSSIARAITLHRRVLEAVKNMEPQERAELLTMIPESLHIKMALGKATAKDLIAALIRRPRLLAKIRKFL